MRALVVGGAGMLGQAVTARWQEKGATVMAAGRDTADLTRPESLSRVIGEFAPDWVVNCAAYTAVDDCESRHDLAMLVNGEGVGNLADATAEAGAALLQISTDYVFDGRQPTPYDEEAPVAPRSVYGLSKLEGERQALRYRRNLVVRTSWLFGPGGGNFAATILRLLRDGVSPLRVVADQHGSPTYAPFLAAALWDLAEVEASGVVHYCNREPTTWHGFAVEIARQAGFETEVLPITTDEMPRPAPRPERAVMSVRRVESLLGRRVESWRRGLELYLEAEAGAGETS